MADLNHHPNIKIHIYSSCYGKRRVANKKYENLNKLVYFFIIILKLNWNKKYINKIIIIIIIVALNLLK